jgi:hypothetical protein
MSKPTDRSQPPRPNERSAEELRALQALDQAEALLDRLGQSLALQELALTHRRLEDPAGACLYLRRWPNCRRAMSRGRLGDAGQRVVH